MAKEILAVKLQPINDDLIKRIRSLLSLDDLEVLIGPATKNQRFYLRQQTLQALKDRNIFAEENKILNLETLPTLNKGDFSLSHSREFQGLMLSQKHQYLGFDIEDPGRVAPAIALRISNSSELQAAPQPSLLWVAKEAAFKVFSKSQGAQLISNIQLNHWTLLTKGMFAVHAHFRESSIEGFAICTNSCFYSGFKS